MTWDNSARNEDDFIEAASSADGASNNREQDCLNCSGEESRSRAEWLVAEILPYEDWLQNWIARRFPKEGDLDDVVQESFERLLCVANTAPIDNPKAYLGQTATSIVLCRIRRRKIVRIDYRDDLECMELHATEPLQDRVAEGREQLDLIEQALKQLPERCREVVRLRRHENLSQRDTAQILGVSVSAIEKDLRRAVRHARAALEESDEDIC
ncbi:RNA polymerase sigma factor [Sphingorhabdus contaminans]|uniref:RNA polymerase sigma factor n=1 Tax=Sphingorhabdus contaminans TaxID=1343899 RepID=A0A553WA81_9SPHN|nr:RNA polymerase sigma factor [Sphingorhabdus contaminans]TSB01581.1 RNA polymerase sigma factor [Sphingorhabdus contaminans]